LGNDVRLSTSAIEICALLAQWLAARALTQIFLLDVVPGIAVRIVVMNGLLNRMPWGFLRH
jgi:hypothetical protein